MVAFYDFDGTLAHSDVVRRYAFYARNHPSRTQAAWRCLKLALSVPILIGLDFYSRRLFNEIFYREYRGMRESWLRELEQPVFERVILPAIYPGAEALLEADRRAGCLLVLVSGELDFALQPVVRHFGFDALISNRLVYRDGVATGEVVQPILAGAEKVEAMKRFCHDRGLELGSAKAYSDSFSDVPMLEAVGHPAAVHPDQRLRRVAEARGWPILDLRRRQAPAEPKVVVKGG